ncbi:Uncharacterised protein [Vibrio cholerae]|nr:Uncharacterised protein [Vibrio cholerae]
MSSGWAFKISVKLVELGRAVSNSPSVTGPSRSRNCFSTSSQR